MGERTGDRFDDYRYFGFPRVTPEEQAFAHLRSLFPTGFGVGEFIEIRLLDCSRTPARPIARSFFRSFTDAANWAMAEREAADVFVGVGMRRCGATNRMSECPHSRVGRDHVSTLTASWGDFDARDGEASATIAGRLRLAHIVPSILVASGRGIHAYWSFSVPTRDLERVEHLNRAIRDQLGGDNAIDAGRILRLAGTFNHKYGPPLPVELLEVSA